MYPFSVRGLCTSVPQDRRATVESLLSLRVSTLMNSQVAIQKQYWYNNWLESTVGAGYRCYTEHTGT